MQEGVDDVVRVQAFDDFDEGAEELVVGFFLDSVCVKLLQKYLTLLTGVIRNHEVQCRVNFGLIRLLKTLLVLQDQVNFSFPFPISAQLDAAPQPRSLLLELAALPHRRLAFLDGVLQLETYLAMSSAHGLCKEIVLG